MLENHQGEQMATVAFTDPGGCMKTRFPKLSDFEAGQPCPRSEDSSEYAFQDIVGNSPAFRGVLEKIAIVAPTSATVLLHGETGTGKELVARAIHKLSRRRQRTFVRLNCAAIPSGL